MNITTLNAQITAKDDSGSSGANINGILHGNVADLQIWGRAVYVARRTMGYSFHIIIAPSDAWKDDITSEGYEIIGTLSDLAFNAKCHETATIIKS